MRIFDYSNTQLINFDIYAGFPVNFSNTSTFPLLAFKVRNHYVFNMYLIKYHWKRFLSIISIIWIAKGNLGIIPNVDVSFTFLYYLSSRQSQLNIFFQKWVPGHMRLQDTWRIFPHFVLNFNTPLACSLWTESNRSGIPLINLVDSNSKVFDFGAILPGNSKSYRSHFFYLALIYKALVKAKNICKFNYNLELYRFITKALQIKYSLFFKSFLLWYKYFNFKGKFFDWVTWSGTASVAFNKANLNANSRKFRLNSKTVLPRLLHETLRARNLWFTLKTNQPWFSRLVLNGLPFLSVFFKYKQGKKLKLLSQKKVQFYGLKIRYKRYKKAIKIGLFKEWQRKRYQFKKADRFSLVLPLDLAFLNSFFLLISSLNSNLKFFRLYRYVSFLNSKIFSLYKKFLPFSFLYICKNFYTRLIFLNQSWINKGIVCFKTKLNRDDLNEASWKPEIMIIQKKGNILASHYFKYLNNYKKNKLRKLRYKGLRKIKISFLVKKKRFLFLRSFILLFFNFKAKRNNLKKLFPRIRRFNIQKRYKYKNIKYKRYNRKYKKTKPKDLDEEFRNNLKKLYHANKKKPRYW